ncbi:MAG: hypothetical protein WC528_05345 [Patescibacteria group bacterium]
MAEERKENKKMVTLETDPLLADFAKILNSNRSAARKHEQLRRFMHLQTLRIRTREIEGVIHDTHATEGTMVGLHALILTKMMDLGLKK